MHKIWLGLLVVGAVVAGFGVLAVLAPAVTAQGPRQVVSPAASDTATPLPTAVPASGTTTVLTGWQLVATLVIVGFGVLLLCLTLLVYTGFIQNRYFETALKLAARGISTAPTVTGSGAFVRPGAEFAEATAKLMLKIKGPASVTVGIESIEYSATVEDETKKTTAPQEVTWSIEPANAAIVTTEKKADKVKVLAKQSGAFILTAKVDSAPGTQALLPVAAVAPQTAKVDLPVFGGSYGSIVIAIILLAVALVLGLTNSIPGAAIATLLGSLAGYIFGERSAVSKTASDTKDKTQS